MAADRNVNIIINCRGDISILKLIFIFLTEQFSLFDNVLYNYVAMGIVGAVAYSSSYGIVGNLYRFGIIDGRSMGHLFHWAIRFIIFVALVLLVSFVNWIVKLIITVPTWVWFALIAIGLITLITCIVRKIYSRQENEQL